MKISLSPKFAWNQLLFENFGVQPINHGSIDFNKCHRSLVSGQLPGYGQVLIAAAPWYGNPGNSQRGRVYILSTSKSFPSANFTDIDQVADQILEGTTENSRFGYSLTLLDYNADGVSDLAVSAPSQG